LIKLSVVMPVYNAADTICLQLDALARQDWSESWELIVADNGSTDDTREIVAGYEERIPALRIIDASGRQGTAHALNEGLRKAHGELFAFCEADDEVAPGWIRAMGEALEEHPLVVSRHDIDKLNPPWVRESRGRSPLATDSELRLPFPPYPLHGPTAGLGVRRELHERIGGFDETLRANHDADYCVRLHLIGVEPVIAPNALLHYRYRDRLGAIFTQARLYAETSAVLQKRYATGHPVKLWRWPLKHWRPILRELARVFRKGSRARLAWLLGWQVGRYVASARHRVLAI
jgi:glycosyltransferase involved in cell wall biosynthesis